MIEPPDPDLPNGEPSRPPVLDKMDALLSRHRPTRAPFPVLTEPVEPVAPPAETRPLPKPVIRPKSRDFPSLLDPDAPPVSDRQRLLLPERPPELEVMLDLDVPVLSAEAPKATSVAPVEPMAPVSVAPVVTPPVLPSRVDLEATTVLELQWEDAELHLQPLELDIPEEWVSAPVVTPVTAPPAPVAAAPDLLPVESAPPPELAHVEEAPPEVLPATDGVDESPVEPVLALEAVPEVEPVWELELEDVLAEAAAPVVVAEDLARDSEPIMAEPPEPAPAPIVDIPVLTELMIEHDEADTPLPPAHEREQWVAELVDEVMVGLAPRIAALVRAQLGLQIGGLMKTVTDKVSEQLLADWRDELQHKVEQRLAAQSSPHDSASGS